MPKAKGKTTRARRRAPAQRGAAAPDIVASEGVVRWTLATTGGLEPILGAAYLLTDRAYARLDGGKKKITVTLKPKADADAKALAELADLWVREHSTQRLRWEVARNNRPVREYVAQQAVLLANGQLPAEPTAGSDLTSDQKAEIDRLIAEVEAEIQEIKKKGEVKDPKGIAASWEEKHAPQAPPTGERAGVEGG